MSKSSYCLWATLHKQTWWATNSNGHEQQNTMDGGDDMWIDIMLKGIFCLSLANLLCHSLFDGSWASAQYFHLQIRIYQIWKAVQKWQNSIRCSRKQSYCTWSMSKIFPAINKLWYMEKEMHFLEQLLRESFHGCFRLGAQPVPVNQMTFVLSQSCTQQFLFPQYSQVLFFVFVFAWNTH